MYNQIWEYFDKLHFLMNITQTSNKELAAALSVDRSLISLMRSGKRGLSRKSENVKKDGPLLCPARHSAVSASRLVGNAGQNRAPLSHAH